MQGIQNRTALLLPNGLPLLSTQFMDFALDVVETLTVTVAKSYSKFRQTGNMCNVVWHLADLHYSTGPAAGVETSFIKADCIRFSRCGNLDDLKRPCAWFHLP